MSYVYLLYSQTADKYYLGYTKDLSRRVLEHQTNQGRWTRGKGPWELVYYEEFSIDCEARKRELQLKKSKNRKYLMWLITNGPGTSVD
ncbi:MAG: GIY-YIG nuclease family protein [Bacteroidota bacterium]